MHLSALLAGLVILLSLEAVHSLSIQKKRNPQLVTVPLKRIPLRSDVHPRIVCHLIFQMFWDTQINHLLVVTNAYQPQYTSAGQDDWYRAALCPESRTTP